MSHAAKVLSHRALRPRHKIGLGFMLLVAVWGILWSLAALRFNSIVSDFVNHQKARGTEIAFTNRWTDGSPFSVHIHLEKFHGRTPSGHEVSAGEAVLYLSPWDWSSVTGKLRDGVEGTLLQAPFKANSIKFGLQRPTVEPADHTETGLSLWIHPFAMSFITDKPLAFGNVLEEGEVHFRVMGAVPDFANPDAIKNWNQANGVFEIDHIDLRWGDLVLMANGTIGLSAELQPEGAFSARVEGMELAIDKLLSQGIINARQESLLRSSLHVLSRPSGLTGGSAPIVPLTIQNSGLYIGPVKLMALPFLIW